MEQVNSMIRELTQVVFGIVLLGDSRCFQVLRSTSEAEVLSYMHAILQSTLQSHLSHVPPA